MCLPVRPERERNGAAGSSSTRFYKMLLVQFLDGKSSYRDQTLANQDDFINNRVVYRIHSVWFIRDRR